ncbi:phospholysine phosphohistidine inorganic pyrophosphate phosphatase isoform X1 [Lathamus discolor]|uniref:phospholysine phosphohistidine inorganic pyrophosphate phosphatase isoform X1 n=1 Tax=Lathamus discolor TaxID=678569 RepID=UPI0032B7B7DB
MAAWWRAVRGVLLDISGVLYDSGGDGGGTPIAGSAEAVRRIKASGLKLRFCTNETQATREKFVKKLQGLGFDISVAEVTAPAPAACRILKERGLRPHLLVHNDLVPEFADLDKANPNCVVIGDAAENFTYANLNEAFRVLIGMEKPVLISLGRGRYYKETDGLKLDVGAYMKALEYACDVEAEVVGKPAKPFFESALAEMGVPPQQAIMIGDDIVNDVGGAQQCGMRAVQVRTGKYRALCVCLSTCRRMVQFLQDTGGVFCGQNPSVERGCSAKCDFRGSLERKPSPVCQPSFRELLAL